MLTIAPIDLFHELQTSNEYCLIDVRSITERNEFNIGGMHIPLERILNEIQSIPKNKKVVVYCQKGIRSQIAIQRIQIKFGINNFINLEGGLVAWKKSIIN